jgi:hypothetical protein
MKLSTGKMFMVALLLLAILVVAFLTAAAPPKSKTAARGEYLVKVAGGNDCHTPLKMGASGPEPDMSRALSGHPETLVMPPAPKVPEGPWMGIFSGTMTTWAGPWGISYTVNLTPDKETGLFSTWTAQTFIDAMRSGKHMGKGRPILPPMPWQNLGMMTDADLKAMFAYLQTIPAIHNKVPDPVPPAAPAK